MYSRRIKTDRKEELLKKSLVLPSIYVYITVLDHDIHCTEDFLNWMEQQDVVTRQIGVLQKTINKILVFLLISFIKAITITYNWRRPMIIYIITYIFLFDSWLKILVSTNYQKCYYKVI